MRRLTLLAATTGLIVLGVLWVMTIPDRTSADELSGFTGDAGRGETVFWAGGCASCHAAPDADGDARLVLTGGQRFPSDFGTFVAPNISPDPVAGIGSWTVADFATALRHGVSPDGTYYYPAFPYTAYALTETQDLVDLWAFWQTLPATPVASLPHDVAFPFNIRRTVGVWNLLFLPQDFNVSGPLEPEVARGRYLAEALAHCGECHTPRNALGALDRGAWLGGAPNPTGDGTIPGLTSAQLNWSAGEISAYLADGFTPEFDSAGGHMVSVIRNLAHLDDDDRMAIAAYLKALP